MSKTIKKIALSTVNAANSFIRIDEIIPAGVTKLKKLLVYAPNREPAEATNIDIEVSLHINSKQEFVGNTIHTLDYKPEDDKESKLITIDMPVYSGQSLNGYVKSLRNLDEDTSINLYLIYE